MFSSCRIGVTSERRGRGGLLILVGAERGGALLSIASRERREIHQPLTGIFQ